MSEYKRPDRPFTTEELAVWGHRDEYFVEILNGEKTVEEAREDLASFRNNPSYTGNDPELMEVVEDD